LGEKEETYKNVLSDMGEGTEKVGVGTEDRPGEKISEGEEKKEQSIPKMRGEIRKK